MPSKIAEPEPQIDLNEDPRTAGKDPTMIPGHPQCNYEKWMATQRKVQVYCPSDQRNPQFRALRLSFNGNHHLEVPYDQHVSVPKPYAEQILLGSMGTTTDAELIKSLEGQIARPITGPIPGPFSGKLPDELPVL